MKKTIIALFILAASCTSGTLTPQATNTVPYDFQLTPLQYGKWIEVQKQYFSTQFPLCLKKRNTVISCARCSGVTFRVILHISKEGKLEKYDIERSRYCGENWPPSFESCIMDYLKGITFPLELKGLTFKCDLGRALKC